MIRVTYRYVDIFVFWRSKLDVLGIASIRDKYSTLRFKYTITRHRPCWQWASRGILCWTRESPCSKCASGSTLVHVIACQAIIWTSFVASKMFLSIHQTLSQEVRVNLIRHICLEITLLKLLPLLSGANEWNLGAPYIGICLSNTFRRGSIRYNEALLLVKHTILYANLLLV